MVSVEPGALAGISDDSVVEGNPLVTVTLSKHRRLDLPIRLGRRRHRDDCNTPPSNGTDPEGTITVPLGDFTVTVTIDDSVVETVSVTVDGVTADRHHPGQRPTERGR